MTSLVSLVTRAARLLNEGFVAGGREFGLSPTEERVLVALAERDGVRMFELAQYAVIKQATLSKAIDALESKRLAARVKTDKDRRCCLVRLSKRGRETAGRLLTHARAHRAVLYHRLGAADMQKLEIALSQLNQVLDEIAGRAPAREPAAPSILL
jgi:DNA-binding MarR family transcriptional regulator